VLARVQRGPTGLTQTQRRALIVFGAVVAVVVWAVIVANAEPYDWASIGPGHDARPYWTALAGQPYGTSRVGAHDAYLYSPAFLEVLSPLRALPWQAFLAGWTAILLLATLALVGPLLLGPVLLLAIPELWGGNVTLLIGLAIVAGFRFSGAWAFPLLTKVTPGLGLVWFGVRREWRALAVAGVTTLVVVVVSFVFAPPAEWRDWVAVLAGNSGAPIDSGSFPLPLLLRLPVALVLTVWAARTGRRWVLPVACLIALPVIWYGSVSLLLAVIPLAFPAWTAWPGRSLVHRWRSVADEPVGARPAESA